VPMKPTVNVLVLPPPEPDASLELPWLEEQAASSRLSATATTAITADFRDWADDRTLRASGSIEPPR
jgi:hypothetical protein